VTDLADVARAAIAAHLERRDFTPPAGSRSAAVAVVLRGPEGERGSAGSTAPGPVAELTARLAVAAADDPRHVPVDAAELASLAIDVVEMGPPRRVRSPEDVDPDADALSIHRGLHAALLLPDAARGWDAAAYLGYLCHKAGLPKASWTDASTVIEARLVTRPDP
jgi:AMMECR1 domain-containing protein